MPRALSRDPHVALLPAPRQLQHCARTHPTPLEARNHSCPLARRHDAAGVEPHAELSQLRTAQYRLPHGRTATPAHLRSEARGRNRRMPQEWDRCGGSPFSSRGAATVAAAPAITATVAALAGMKKLKSNKA